MKHNLAKIAVLLVCVVMITGFIIAIGQQIHTDNETEPTPVIRELPDSSRHKLEAIANEIAKPKHPKLDRVHSILDYYGYTGTPGPMTDLKENDLGLSLFNLR